MSFGVNIGGSVPLKLEPGQTVEGGLYLAVETGFVAIHHFEGAGAVAEALENDVDSGGGRQGGDISRLLVAFVVEAGAFDIPQTAETPFGDGHDLDKSLLGGALGLVLLMEASEEFVEVFQVFSAKDYAAGEHAVTGGIFGAAGFAFRGDGAPGFQRVDAIGGDFSVRCHK
jgi:hypothetical protein